MAKSDSCAEDPAALGQTLQMAGSTFAFAGFVFFVVGFAGGGGGGNCINPVTEEGPERAQNDDDGQNIRGGDMSPPLNRAQTVAPAQGRETAAVSGCPVAVEAVGRGCGLATAPLCGRRGNSQERLARHVRLLDPWCLELFDLLAAGRWRASLRCSIQSQHPFCRSIMHYLYCAVVSV